MNLWDNGTVTQHTYSTVTPSLHETPFVGNASLEWITNHLQSPDDPFFAYIGPHAPHFPYTPPAWYENLYTNVTAPRTPNFNKHFEDFHGFVSTNPSLQDDAIAFIDQSWGDRLACMLAVDDIISSIVESVNKYDPNWENTYFIYTSDHGYHLGQWRIACAKKQAYETDIR